MSSPDQPRHAKEQGVLDDVVPLYGSQPHPAPASGWDRTGAVRQRVGIRAQAGRPTAHGCHPVQCQTCDAAEQRTTGLTLDLSDPLPDSLSQRNQPLRNRTRSPSP